jgi:hypothetical protein
MSPGDRPHIWQVKPLRSSTAARRRAEIPRANAIPLVPGGACANRYKINHALVIGGAPGIGKDTLFEPVKQAIGPWNFVEVSPSQIMGRFTGFLKSVILRVSEVRDLGEVNRYEFYEHMKAYTAARQPRRTSRTVKPLPRQAGRIVWCCFGIFAGDYPQV